MLDTVMFALWEYFNSFFNGGEEKPLGAEKVCSTFYTREMVLKLGRNIVTTTTEKSAPKRKCDHVCCLVRLQVVCGVKRIGAILARSLTH